MRKGLEQAMRKGLESPLPFRLVLRPLGWFLFYKLLNSKQQPSAAA